MRVPPGEKNMQLKNQIMTAPAAAEGRRASRAIPLVACFPLFIAVAVAGAGRVYEHVEGRIGDGRRVGAMTRRQAVASVMALCARLAPGVTIVEPSEVSGYDVTAAGRTAVHYSEWQIQCRTANGTYVVRLNAKTGEPVLVRREREAGDRAATANGDVRGDLSLREAMSWVRRYLRLAGLPLPDGSQRFHRRGYDFTFLLPAADGAARMLRVRVNRKDGDLEHLYNVVYRKFPAEAGLHKAPWGGGSQTFPKVSLTLRAVTMSAAGFGRLQPEAL
jgi:hypothetical protein